MVLESFVSVCVILMGTVSSLHTNYMPTQRVSMCVGCCLSVRACVRACVRAYVRACVHVCVCVRAHLATPGFSLCSI